MAKPDTSKPSSNEPVPFKVESDLSIDECLDRADAYQARAEELQNLQRDSVKAKILETINVHGISLEELKGAGIIDAAKSLDVSAPREGRKVPIKYRSADGKYEWSGRGVQPKWIVDHLNGGNTLDEILVKHDPKP